MLHVVERDSAMVRVTDIEEVCDRKGITLVVHPAIREAVERYDESFYIGACCFLRGETNGLYFLPLDSSAYVPLRFSRRHSSGGHPILRVDPITSEGLDQIKRTVRLAFHHQGLPPKGPTAVVGVFRFGGRSTRGSTQK